MPVINVPNLGPVNFPDTMSEDQIKTTFTDLSQRAAAKNKIEYNPDYRDLGLGQLIKGGFNRSLSSIGSGLTDVVPAMVGSALGYKDYAKEQMAEAAEKRRQAELENPTGYSSYTKIRGPGDLIGYGAETIGELGPDILGMLVPGGVGSAVGRRVATRGVAELAGARAAERAAEKGLTGEAAEAFTARLTDKAVEKAGRAGAETGLNTGMFGGAYALNTPETFQGIYEKTGEFAPGTAAVFGAAQAALDSVLPSYLLKQLGPAGKSRLASELINRSTVVEPSIKMGIAKGVSKTALGEGGTETLQEALGILAEKTAGAKGEFFSPENVDRLINAGLKGAIGGGVLGTPGGIKEAFDARAAAREEIARREGLPPEASTAPAGPGGAFSLPDNIDRPATQRRPDYVARPGLRESPLPEADPNQLDMFPDEKIKFSLDEVRAARIAEPGSSTTENLEVAKLKLLRKEELTNGEVQLLVDNKIITPEAVRSIPVKKEEAPPPEVLPGQPYLPGMSPASTDLRRAIASGQYTQPELPLAGGVTQQQTIGTPPSPAAQPAALFRPPAPPTPAPVPPAPPVSEGPPPLQESLPGMGLLDTMSQPGLPGMGNQRPRKQQEETQPLQSDTIVTAEELKGLGLTPRMGAYKALVDKNLNDPQQKQGVINVLNGLLANKLISDDVKKNIRAYLAGSAFQQTEMFGPSEAAPPEPPSGPPPQPNNPPSGTRPSVPRGPRTGTPAEVPSAPPPSGVGSDATPPSETGVGTGTQPPSVETPPGQPASMDLGTALRGKPRSEEAAAQEQENLTKSIETTGEGTFRAAPGVDMTRMANLLGPQLYGNMSKISSVTVKEMFQNAFDAIKDALVKGGLTEGIINVDTDESKRTITITDNGMGMTPEIISKAFLTIAGTHKESGRGSGGFGVAKMLFLFGNKNLKLETTRDGLTSTLETTGPELLAAFSDPSKAPNITTTKTGKPSGTSITVTIPDTYLDEEDQTRNIYFGSDYATFKPILIKSPLLENIEVNFNSEVLPIGKNFPAQDFTVLTNVKFPWGNARILVKDGADVRYNGDNLIVLSQGLYQFGETLKDGPGWDANPLPFTFFINIEPTVAAENANYPFALNRQDFSPSQKPGVEKIFSYLQALYTNKTTAESAQSFGKLELLSPSRNPTSTEIDLAVPPAQKGTILEIDPADTVEVKDGKMYVNNRLVPELTPQALEAMRSDPSQFRVDQSLIDSNKILVHDNVNVREDYDDPDSNQLPFLEKARADLGAAKVNKFIVEIGNIFKFLRNEAYGADIKGWRGANKYDTVTEVPVGVSFDPGYYGVSIRLPFSGMMVNPTIIRGIDKDRTSSADVRRAAAVKMVSTMVHEIAHHDERNHSESGFIPALQELLVQLSTSGSTQEAVKDLIKVFSNYQDVLEYFLKAGDGNLKNRGIKLEGATESTVAGGASVPRRAAGVGTSGGNAKVSPGVRQPAQAGGRPSTPSPKPAAAPATPQQSLGPTAVEEAALNPIGKKASAFLEATAAALEKLPFMTQKRADAVHEFLKNTTSSMGKNFLLMSLPLNALVEVAEKYLPGAKKIALLDKLKSGDEYARNKKIEPVVLAAEKWAKSFPKLVDTFNRVVYRSTIGGVDPSKPVSEYVGKKDDAGNDKVATWNALQADYKALGVGGRQLYAMTRDLYKDMYKEIESAISAKILAAYPEDPKAGEKVKTEILARLAEKGNLDPYFPLTRYGDLWVSYYAKGGEGKQAEYVVRAFETERERDRFIKALKDNDIAAPRFVMDEEGNVKKDANGKPIEEPSIQTFSKLSEINYKNTPPNSFVNGVLKIMDLNKVPEEAREQVLRLFLSTLPETSFAQAFQKRKGTAGFEHDAIRALREKSFSMSRQLSNMKYSYQLIAELDKLKAKVKAMGEGEGATDNKVAKEYYNELAARVKFISSPSQSPTSQFLTSFGFTYLLGFNVSSAVINLSQVPLVVLPYLGGKYGMSETSRAIAKAYKVFANSNGGKVIKNTSVMEYRDETGKLVKLETRSMPSIENYAEGSKEHAHYKELIDAATLQGLLNRSALYDALDVSGAKGPLAVMNAASGWMFHHAERTNRQVSLIAAYDLALSKYKNPTTADKQAAAEQAIYDTEMTNGGVTATSAPRIAQGDIGRVLFMFKRYGASMYYLLAKNFNDALRGADKNTRAVARQQLGYTYAMAGLFAGLQGLPMMGVLAVIYNLFADDDDDDYGTMLRKTAGEGWYKGLVNYLTGVDVASRTGLSDLLIRDNKMSSGSQTLTNAFMEMMGGPVYGIATKVERGMNQIRDGHLERGLENILPSAMGNAFKSFRYATQGTQTLRGDPITGDVDAIRVLGQAFGFTPAEYSRQLEITAREKGLDKYVTSERTKQLRLMYVAKRFGDADGVQDAREALEKLYSKHPGLKKFGSLDETIARSMKQHAMTTEQMKPFAGVTISKGMRDEILQDMKEFDD